MILQESLQSGPNFFILLNYCSYVCLLNLNCSLCKFNRYFADNYGDICFLKKDKPNGYEFIEKYNKFASCDYCCKTGKNNDICNISILLFC